MPAEEKNGKPRKRGKLKRIVLAVVVGLVVVMTFGSFWVQRHNTISETQLRQATQDRRVASATFYRKGDIIEVKFKGDALPHYVNYKPSMATTLNNELMSSGADVRTEGQSWWAPAWDVFIILGGALAAVIGWNFLRKLAEERKRNTIDAGDEDRPKITFDDVQGIDEVVDRAREIVDQARNPENYTALGARMPKGIILYGPPGAGKTFLTRAIAGQAGVPMISMTGPRLMNKWFGGSAEKVEALYRRARLLAQKHGFCVVFLDEVDAIARQRSGSGGSGGDEERDAALNQLLSELDGFEGGNVITIVATNRLEILDAAFLRAGRFDVQLYVGAPDVRGREAILRVHAGKRPKVAADVDFRELARRMIGSLGADLARLVNEAALVAARSGAGEIGMNHFYEAIDIVEMGPARKGVRMSDAERRVTAYHEGGHALAALYQPHADSPVRVTIVPRGQAGGVTWVPPEEDRYFNSQDALKAQLVWAMAGLAGEKIACGPESFTNGPSSDRRQATELALQMVCLWGMGTYNTHIPLETWMRSPHARQVEEQVEKMLDEAEKEAIRLLLKYKNALEDLVKQLLTEETVDRQGLEQFAHYKPREGTEWAEVDEEYHNLIASVKTVMVA